MSLELHGYRIHRDRDLGPLSILESVIPLHLGDPKIREITNTYEKSLAETFPDFELDAIDGHGIHASPASPIESSQISNHDTIRIFQ